MSGSSKWISMSLAANSRTGKGADQRCGSPTEISPAPIHDEWRRQEAAALRECQLGHQVKGVKRVRSQYCSFKPVRPEVSKGIFRLRYLSPNGFCF